MRVGGTWRAAKELWYRTGGTWRMVFQLFVVNISPVGPFNSNAGGVDLRFDTDGRLWWDLNNVLQASSWGLPLIAGIGSSHWVRGTLGAGDGAMGGTSLGVWHQISANILYTMTGATPGNLRERDVLFEIATDSAGATVVDTQNITFTSDRT